MTEPAGRRDLLETLAPRVGAFYLRQRLATEEALEAYVRRRRLDVEHWHSDTLLVRTALKATGLYWRGRRNTERIQVRHNPVTLRRLPPSFDGFTILHLSDLHADRNPAAMRALLSLLPDLRYDVCVLTGDFRGKTFGPSGPTLREMARLRSQLHQPVYGVLGNHDSITMVPALEDLGFRIMLNECETLRRGTQSLHLVGIDDPHFYRTHNFEKAAGHLPADDCAILLSHSAEVYRQAAHAGFSLMLSGHTHGGQICLPGAVPLWLNARAPRRFGSGAWRYHNMLGYTSAGVGSSIVTARFNCPPEAVLHELSSSG